MEPRQSQVREWPCPSLLSSGPPCRGVHTCSAAPCWPGGLGAPVLMGRPCRNQGTNHLIMVTMQWPAARGGEGTCLWLQDFGVISCLSICDMREQKKRR